MSCSLCVLDKLTKWYYEDPSGRFAIIECASCRVPLAVWRNHTMDVDLFDFIDMVGALTKVVDRVLGENRWYIDFRQRQVPGHLHIHTRRIER